MGLRFLQLLVSAFVFSVLCAGKGIRPGRDAGEPLMLTPYIEAGRVQEAQEKCMMSPMKGDIISYAGFLTVNKQYDSNMFFTFFPALEHNETAPVILWLQGDVGTSSFYGLFNEHGPFFVKKKHGLHLRDDTWIKSHSVIYIDSPIGVGFSFTKNAAGFSRIGYDVATDLYNALLQFFKLFPQFQNNNFFIAGHLYGGRFVTDIAYMIYTNNPSASFKIKLKGLIIGNGFTDLKNMLNYGNYLFQIGLLNYKGKELFIKRQQEILNFVQQKKFREAYLKFDALIAGSMRKSLFYELTGFTSYHNYLHDSNNSTFGDIERYLSLLDTRKNLHVGNTTFNDFNPEVRDYLADNLVQTTKVWTETLLNNYRVLFYNGQLDVIAPYSMTEEFIDGLNWSGSSDFKNAVRKSWFMGNELAGYVTTARGLTFALIRNAGHFTAVDQPKWTLDLITKFIGNQRF